MKEYNIIYDMFLLPGVSISCIFALRCFNCLLTYSISFGTTYKDAIRSIPWIQSPGLGTFWFGFTALLQQATVLFSGKQGNQFFFTRWGVNE